MHHFFFNHFFLAKLFFLRSLLDAGFQHKYLPKNAYAEAFQYHKDRAHLIINLVPKLNVRHLDDRTDEYRIDMFFIEVEGIEIQVNSTKLFNGRF